MQSSGQFRDTIHVWNIGNYKMGENKLATFAKKIFWTELERGMWIWKIYERSAGKFVQRSQYYRSYEKKNSYLNKLS